MNNFTATRRQPRIDPDLALSLAYRDFPLLRLDETIQEALNKFRSTGLQHKIIYFYVVDDLNHLQGVLPTRALFTADLRTPIRDVVVRKIIALPETATREEARAAFSKHRFLAFPIVDRSKRVLGVLDIQRFAGDLGDIHQRTGFDDVYELLGVHATASTETSGWSSFQMRFPWLLSTMVAGTVSALLTGAFEHVLQRALILAFFLTMVLGLNESVAMQSATLMLQRLHHEKASQRPNLRWLAHALKTEVSTGLLLGTACALIVGIITYAWRKDPVSSISISLSLFAAILLSCLWGILVPFFMRRFQKDPKVAAGPIALGLSDMTTLLLYFGLARMLL